MSRIVVTLIAAAACAGGAGAQTLNEYTLALPDSVSPEHTLCQISVVSRGISTYVATMMHEDTDPLPDGSALRSDRTDLVYRAWVADRGGVRTLVVQTEARNRFNVEAGFCRTPADPSSPVMDFVPVNAPLVGGSPYEEDTRGHYDGVAEILVDTCGHDDPFDLVERFEQALDDAALTTPGAVVSVRSYAEIAPGYAWIRYDLAGHPRSLQTYAESVRAGVVGFANVDVTVGDRTLDISGCDRKGLWVVVENGDGIAWANRFEGARLLATRQEVGNLFITYAAGVDSIFLNFAGAAAAGEYRIGPVPDEDDPRDPLTLTWGRVHFDSSPAMPHVVGSTRGVALLTAVASDAGASGRFRFAAEDEDGVPHQVRGGFRDVTLR